MKWYLVVLVYIAPASRGSFIHSYQHFLSWTGLFVFFACLSRLFVCFLFSVCRTFWVLWVWTLSPSHFYWCFDLFTVSLVILKFNFCQFCVILHNHFHLWRVILFSSFLETGEYIFAWKVSPNHLRLCKYFSQWSSNNFILNIFIFRSFIVLESISLWYSSPVLFQKKIQLCCAFYESK